MREERLIYMDNAATTPLDERVLSAMMPYFKEEFGNASAIYDLGQRARKAVQESREKIAALIGASPAEIYFTGSGTESDNWALLSAADRGDAGYRGSHIVTSRIEHHAVLRTCAWLEQRGAKITYLDVDSYGRVRPEDVAAAIRPETVLVSIMTANNEIGTLEPVAEIGEICRENGVLFHTDAVQAFGHIPVDVEAMHIDYLSASAHKINGPKGTGILYMRKGKSLRPLLHGGAQEHDRRAGTENVPGIVGFGTAAEIAAETMEVRACAMRPVREYLIKELTGRIGGCSLNGHPEERLPNNVSVCIPGVDGEQLVNRLSRAGIAAGSGAACSSGSLEPSHVLKAIGRTHAESFSGLRLSISHATTMEEAEQAAETIVKLCKI